MFAWIRYSKNVMFTVLSFGQVNNVFGLLYSVILQGQIWPSFLGHLNSPRYILWLNLNISWYNCSKYVKISNFLTFSSRPSLYMQYTTSARKTRVLASPVSLWWPLLSLPLLPPLLARPVNAEKAPENRDRQLKSFGSNSSFS